jgi:tetratricopeptide (TPR) repeat protein
MVRNQIDFALLSAVVRRLLLAGFCCLLVASCFRPEFLAGIGTGGLYLQGKEEVTKRRGGDMDKAIGSLEKVVVADPTYKDSLTLLGRAYYNKARLADAHAILQRALALNSSDEIAWLVFGITQLRLNDVDKGVQSLQGGLTLFNKVSERGYRGFRYWDRAGKVKIATRRAIFTVSKGVEARKEETIQSVENLLAIVDEEEWYLQMEAPQDQRREIDGVGGR